MGGICSWEAGKVARGKIQKEGGDMVTNLGNDQSSAWNLASGKGTKQADFSPEFKALRKQRTEKITITSYSSGINQKIKSLSRELQVCTAKGRPRPM